MNIIKLELLQNYRQTLIWSIVASFFAIIYIALSPLFIEQSAIIMDFMSSLGEDLLQGFGINFENFFSPIGFFSYIGTYLFLGLGIQAMSYGLRSFVREKNQKSLEFLYVKPISRNRIYCCKLIANLILLIFTQVIVISVILIATDFFNKLEYNHLLMLKLTLVIVPIQLLFLSLGALIGVSVNKLKNVVTLSIMVNIGMFIMNMLASILDSKVLMNLSFYSYFNLSEIVSTEQYEMKFIILTIILIIIFNASSIMIINKRDLKII